MTIKLSMCIPTWNHAQYIGKTLDSIISQATDEVEIVISDNGSTDNTPEIIHHYQKLFPRITYYRWEVNMGFDVNAINVIKQAQGEYCWLVSSDDWVEDGAIKQILNFIDKGIEKPTGITVEANTYDINENLIESPDCYDSPVILKGKKEIYSYKDLGLRFGFLSAHIFSRSKALEVMDKHSIFHNLYSMHHLMTYLANDYEDWVFSESKLIAWRSENDTIERLHGIYNRFLIDLDNYRQNVSDVFGADSEIYYQFVNNQLTRCVKGYIYKSKKNGEFLKVEARALKTLWRYPRFWTNIFPVYFIPDSLIPVSRKIFRRLKTAVNG